MKSYTLPLRIYTLASLLAGLLAPSAWASHTDLVCATILTDAPTSPQGSVTALHEHLIARGFGRIGHSGLFVADQVLIASKPDGTVRLFFENYYWPTDWMTRKPFVLLSAREGVLAIRPGRDGRLNIIDTRHADAPFPMRDLATPEARRPIVEQLLHAGFKAVSGAPGVYEAASAGRDQIGIIEDGKLVRLFGAMASYHADRLPERYRILGVTGHHFDNGNYSGPYSELTISDNQKEITLTSFDDPGRVVRQKILVPIDRHEDNSTPPTTRAASDETFTIGGTNSGEAIKKLQSLNDIPIATLEANLRPGAMSQAGFLGMSESLKAVMLADNAYVVGELKLNHRQLAEPMRMAEKIWRDGGSSGEVQFSLEGRPYKVTGTAWRGMQHSPFGDPEGTNVDLEVTNLANGAKIKYSGLVPHLIRRYGFYEGPGTHYRVDPRKLVEVFDYLR